MTKLEPEAENCRLKGLSISGSVGKTQPTAHSEAVTTHRAPQCWLYTEARLTTQDPNRLRSRLGPTLRKACD